MIASAARHSIRAEPLLSHSGGSQQRRHLLIRWIMFPSAEKIGEGFALEQSQFLAAGFDEDTRAQTSCCDCVLWSHGTQC